MDSLIALQITLQLQRAKRWVTIQVWVKLTSRGDQRSYSTVYWRAPSLGCFRVLGDWLQTILQFWEQQFVVPTLCGPSHPQSGKFAVLLQFTIPSNPVLIQVANQTMNIPFPVCNSATLRYTLFAGEVNVNDIFTINPFKDIFYYFTVSGEQIRPVIERLNNPPHQGETVSRSEPSFGEHERAITSARYYYSSLQVRNSTTYDLLCAEYDSSQILSALRAL